MPRTGKSGNGRHGNVIAKQQRSGAGSPTPSIENDVVGSGSHGEVDVTLDMLSAELVADRNATTDLAYAGREIGEVFHCIQIGKGRR